MTDAASDARPTSGPGGDGAGSGFLAFFRRFSVPIVLLIALSAGGLAMCGLPGDTLDDGEGIAGVYVVNGEDPVEIEYSGTVAITPTDERGVYTIEWVVTGTIQRGVGRLSGDVLTVDWETVVDARGESTGTAEYTVGDDGVLRGTRTIDGVDGVGTEEIFPEP